MSKSIRLVRTAKPKSDESFVGYIVRLTERNVYQKASWLLDLARLKDGKNSLGCAFVFNSYKSLSLLSELTGVNSTELAQLTYPEVTNSSSSHLHWFLGQPVPQYVLRPAHPKICPDCLSESLYCRRIWELSFVTACPVHDCLLIDECPKCRKSIAPGRASICICYCMFDWRDSSAPPAKESELALTRQIHRLCGLTLVNDCRQSEVKQNPITSLSLCDLISAVVFIAGQYEGLSSTTHKHLVPSGKNNDLHHLLIKAYSVFEHWPNNYFQFIDWRIAQERNVLPLKQRQKSPLYKDFGKFYIGLYSILAARQFSFMRDAFLEYLVKYWKGSHTSDLNQDRDQPTNYSSKYVSKTDAIRLLKVDQLLSVDKLTRQGKLKIKIRSKGKKRLIFIELMDIAKLLHKSNRLQDS